MISEKNDSSREKQVKLSFDKQGLMAHLGAKLIKVRPGYCEILLPFRLELTQHHGYFHAGSLSAIIDTAGGFAGLTLFKEDESVLTVEFKVNLIAPAVGECLIARGEVIKAGRTLTTVKGEVFALREGEEFLVAVMQQTLMRMAGPVEVEA
ncbi:MAG: hypothetical protein CBB68_11395 [Rhodospirillaceae bacterium TMED8]|nr:DUF4442 domain-containing protein [Magnetovibrio sp.]OUT49603.1 MAG: hypothetical protein CBB68_11395 [Rhodospirillaceae bacterium TMED8]|tara:strand:+ start:1298 stop:1750 length:453 start_codon:yes stop_codon:yes gene_type:complete